MQKIFVVDDSETDRTLIRKFLQSGYSGCEIVELKNGESLIERALKEQPDLILLDIVMPGENGYEVCRKLKRNERTKSIPLIFISGRDKKSDIFWGKNQGADEYLTKPFEPSQLLTIVHELLHSNPDMHYDG